MRQRLSLLTVSIVLLAASVGLSASKLPTLDVSEDSVTVHAGDQTLTVRLADASLRLDTPYGSRDLAVNIDSPSGSVHPLQAASPPKVYRAKDWVAALITFPVPDDRKLTLHVDACPGVNAVFVKSSLTGQCAAVRDYYCWTWSEQIDSYFAPDKGGPERRRIPSKTTRFDYSDWVFLPCDTGGVAVLTSGVVGYAPGAPFINAVPKSRFLRPGETLDIGFGLAGMRDATETAALATLVRARSIPALKRAYPATTDYGARAPDWLRDADVCVGWADDVIGKSSLVIGVPARKSSITKVHGDGARAIVRVDFTQFVNSETQTGKLVPDEADPDGLLDLAKHPDWVCIDSQGNPRKSARGLGTCLHQPDLRQAVLTYVCNIMNLGADGILVDNAVPIPECYAPKFDKHTHPNPDASNTGELEALSREIYKLVKSLGDDKIVILNSGIAPSLWSCCDAQMWEGFRFDQGSSEPVNEWSELQYLAEEHADAVRHGKALIVLPHFSSVPADQRKKDFLYIYAFTRLYGWLMACSPDTQKLAESTRAVQLGKPLDEVKPTGDALYRVFEKGIVALNPTRTSLTVSLPIPHDGKLTDVAYDRELLGSGGKVEMDMAPESGRVLVWQ
jgi:hypothetical protein